MKGVKLFVFDTNVLVSSMIFPRSMPALALKRAFNTGMVMVSAETMDELARVAMNEKFDKYTSFSKRQIFLIDFENAAVFMEVKDDITLSRDPDDDNIPLPCQSSKSSSNHHRR